MREEGEEGSLVKCERLPYEYPVLINEPPEVSSSPIVYRRSKTSFSSPPVSPSTSALGSFDYYL